MGHQTQWIKCKKCEGLIITTVAFGKKIVTKNCKCNSNKNNENTKK